MNSLSHIPRHRLIRLSFSTASAASSPSPSSHFQRRIDDESRSVRVSVWWDFENCQPPSDENAFKIANYISHAVRVSGIKGPLQITAFGDIYKLSRYSQEALTSSGITLTHVPGGGKNSADRSLLLDLMYWVSQNPPPAHLFLISGDRDFAGILHKLRMSNYNVLLACGDSAPSVLCSAATIMWKWNAIVKGNSVTGRHFNQPPDGPFNSWYGQYKGALEDPFAVDKPPAADYKKAVVCDSKAKCENKAVSVSKLEPLPRDCIKEISDIVNMHPDGIPITALRERCLDKNLYGHRNYSQLLLSLSKIVRLGGGGVDGQFLVLPAHCKASQPVNSSAAGGIKESSMTAKHKVESNSQGAEKAGSVSVGKNHGQATSPIVEDHSNSVKRFEEKSTLSPSDYTDEKKSVTKVGKNGGNAQVKKGWKTSLEEIPSVIKSGAHVIENQIAPEGDKKSTEELPSGKESGTHTIESHITPENKNTLSKEIPSLKKSGARVIENHIAPEIEKTSLGELHRRKGSGAHVIENHYIGLAGNQDSEAELGFFRKQLAKWFKRRGTVSHEESDGVSDKVQASIPQPSNLDNSQGAHDSQKSGVDNKVSSVAKDDAATVDADHGDQFNHSPSFFMNILGWFKLSRKGSDTNVSNEPLKKSNLLQTSKRDELLLMDSFWSDVQAFLNTYKGTKVIWNSKTREEIAQNLRKEGPLVIKPLEEIDLLHMIDLLISEKKWIEERPSSTYPFRVIMPTRDDGASARKNNSGRLRSIILNPSSQPEKLPEQQEKDTVSSGTTTEHCCKTKDEVLVDCRKLLDDILKENPEGISISLFKRKFAERYDYSIDYRKFGHMRLSYLLQALPEVEVGVKHVYPKSAAAKQPAPEKFFQFEDKSTGKDLRKAKHEENDSPWEELGPVDGSAPSRNKLKPIIKVVENKYEPPASYDDDMSDSEGESMSSSTQEESRKARTTTDDSSLMQILDSWNQNEDSKSDFPQETSDFGRSDAGSGKQRTGKSYTFVVDPDEGCKDRLIDGILDNLKKSGDHRIPN